MKYELTLTYKEGTHVKKYHDYRHMMGRVYWLLFDRSKAGKELPIVTITVVGSS